MVATAIGGLLQTPRHLPGWEAITIFGALVVIRAILAATAQKTAFEVGAKVRTALRRKLVERLSGWSPLDPNRPASGAAAVLGSEHVEAIVPYVTRYVPAQIRMGLVPLAILVAVLWKSWLAALILIVAGPLIPVFMTLIGIVAKAASDRQMEALLGINVYLSDRLAGLQDLRILKAEGLAGRRLSAHAKALKDASMKVLAIAFLSSAVLELFAALGVALVAVYIGFYLLNYIPFGTWGPEMGLSQGLFILMLAPDFFTPLRDFAATYHDRASALAAADALGPVLETERLDLPATAPEPAPKGVAIALKGVGFAYPGQAAVLSGVDLFVRTGEHLAVTGPSGAGKSTLLALMGRLGAPDSGAVRIGAEGASPRIAWIGQAPHFLRTSLKRNLTLGRAGIDEAAIATALDLSGASEVVARLPGGLATLLGESAQGLSGGEAQRMALARAYLADADIILADEPTAHLDRETADMVTERLLAVAKGKTLVVATHDPVLSGRLERVVAIAELTAAPQVRAAQ